MVAATNGGGATSGSRVGWSPGGRQPGGGGGQLAFSVARSLAALMACLAANNNPALVKKLGRDIWDIVTPLVSSGAHKRSATGGPAGGGGRGSGVDQPPASLKERGEVFLFLERISSQELCLLVLSLLTTLFNVAR